MIRDAWESGRLNQREVEARLGIRQSQFSKLVNGKFKRASGHAVRLYEYSKSRIARRREPDAAAPEEVKRALTDRLMRAWDGTPDGAKALESILEGLTRLRGQRGPAR